MCEGYKSTESSPHCADSLRAHLPDTAEAFMAVSNLADAVTHDMLRLKASEFHRGKWLNKHAADMYINSQHQLAHRSWET